MPNGNDYQLWIDYKNAGGRLSYNQWVEQERPGIPAEKGRIRFPWETITGEGFIAPWTPQVARPTQEGIRFAQPRTLAERQAEAIPLVGLEEAPEPPPEEKPPGFEPPGFETWNEAYESKPNENWEVYKNEFGRFDIRRKEAPTPLPTGLTPYQEQQAELQRQQQVQQQEQWEAELDWQRHQARLQQQPTPISPYQQQQIGLQEQQLAQQRAQEQQQFGLQQQQFEAGQQQFQQQLEFQQAQVQAAQAEQERQYMSQLQAQPINWLQYASYTGQPPVVQPWMVPLGAQGAETSLQVGQPLPGFQGQPGQQGQQTFGNLPQLRTPSAQLQARWGPTAQAQFLGYRRARTGAAPEETQFRLGAGRAPTGRFGGFSRFR